MAWEATYLLPPVLLVLLASGSWEQKPEMLHKLEGEMMSVRCPYQPWQGLNKMKIWCRKISVYSCDETVTNFQKVPRHSIQDYPGSGYFIVTKTELRVEDSGTYWCGISKSSRILLLRAIHLVVSKGAPGRPQPGPLPSSLSLTGTVTPSPVLSALHFLPPTADFTNCLQSPRSHGPPALRG
ncbi:trem-like transcript 4 protein [Diceros bicornis minor]|uniref:trem-like transcript 4 protein n=1 Tax=Diceros bicornis minor TaxID=77932 RepID=UPI0026F309C4|nr:trem-like transcript 4 protein [Diceros bicornis minor]